MLVVYLLNGNYEPVNVRNKCSGAETVEEWRRRRPFLPAPSLLRSSPSPADEGPQCSPRARGRRRTCPLILSLRSA